MKHLLWLLVVPAQLMAQAPRPLHMGRPSFAVTGLETMPMMMIDEKVLSPERFERLTFPQKFWEQEKTCLASLGKPVDKVGFPPDLLVIPAVRTFRSVNITVDSMVHAADSTFVGEYWEPPTIAAALIHSNFIIVIDVWRLNPYVLRHEALHFMLWRQGLVPLGHPREYFEPCDVNYEPDNAS